MNSSSIQFLNDSNFSVDTSGILHVSIPGFSLVLFYSTQCPHCKDMMEAVKRMPTIINGCSFGVINLDQNKGVIQKCAKSQLKLKYVPYLVFFASGVPYMVYNGPTDENEIKRFIVQVSDAYVKEFESNSTPSAPAQSQMNQQQGRQNIRGNGMGGNGTGGNGTGGNGMGGNGMGGNGMGGNGMGGKGMGGTRPQTHGSAKPNLDLACSLDDMACLEHSIKKYSGCYVSMEEAYVNNIS